MPSRNKGQIRKIASNKHEGHLSRPGRWPVNCEDCGALGGTRTPNPLTVARFRPSRSVRGCLTGLLAGSRTAAGSSCIRRCPYPLLANPLARALPRGSLGRNGYPLILPSR